MTRRWALLMLLAGLLGALNAAMVVHADEVERFIPASRSSRAAVLTRAEVTEIATETVGAERAGYWTRIAWCESTWNMRATSNWPYIGLAQIDHRLHRDKVAVVVGRSLTVAESADYLGNGYVNLLVGALVLSEQGWLRGWPWCSRHA